MGGSEVLSQLPFRCRALIHRFQLMALTPPPATPYRITAVVAQFQNLIAFFYFRRDDCRLTAKSDFRTLHFDFVLGLEFYILILNVKTRTKVH